MKTEPSDIVALLRLLAERNEDHVCRVAADMAHCGTPILEVCRAAIEALSNERKAARDLATSLAVLQPTRYVMLDPKGPTL